MSFLFHKRREISLGFCFGWLVGLSFTAAAVAAEPQLSGYRNFAQFKKYAQQLAERPLVSLDVLDKTVEGREILLLSVARGKPTDKPAILIVGNIHAQQIVGSEVAIRLVDLLTRNNSTKQIESLLDAYTLYVIARPSPDATERCFASIPASTSLNGRAWDNDRDGLVDEDPPEDLNKDKQITQMRVSDPKGTYIAHPDDPRILIKADPKKGERGKYLLYTEGVDNDRDGRFNEDGAGGVDFNRNFTYRYPYFAEDAGPNQVSERETRAIADFAFSHPNIALVYCFGLEDNLAGAWATGSDKQKNDYDKDDQAYLGHVRSKLREVLPTEHAPSSPDVQGSFAQWAYFHYGRPTFCSRIWWVAQGVGAEEESAQKDKQQTQKDRPQESDNKSEANAGGSRAQEKKEAASGEEKDSGDKQKKSSPEKREADTIRDLKLLQQQGIAAFADWKKIKHPDFPGKKVEVGGFYPYLRLNPPVKQIDPLVEQQLLAITQLATFRPQLRITEKKVESLGAGIYRIEVTISNEGYLPTISARGVKSRHTYPVQIALEQTEAVEIVDGSKRQAIPALAGSGGSRELTWLVRKHKKTPQNLRITASAPAVGKAATRIRIP